MVKKRNPKALIPLATVQMTWGKRFTGPITKVTKRRVYITQTFAEMQIDVGLPRSAIDEIKRR